MKFVNIAAFNATKIMSVIGWHKTNLLSYMWEGRIMQKFIAYHIAIFILTCITGCGTTRQMVHFPDQSKVVEDQGKARIYVIGSPLFMNLASNNVTLTVVADKEWIGDIVGHSYLCWEHEPGIVTISGRRLRSNIVNINLESGKTYYVIAHIGPDFKNASFLIPGGGEIIVRLEQVSEENGRVELLKCEPPELIK